MRTGFPTVNGSPAQRIAEAGPVPLPIVDLSGLDPEACSRTAERLGREEAARPFDLSRGSLLRTALIRQSADEHVALQTMHHIVSDGWLMGVLNAEVRSLYLAYSEGRPSPLEELPSSTPTMRAGSGSGSRESGSSVSSPTGRSNSEARRRLWNCRPIIPARRSRPIAARGQALRLSEELSRSLKELSRRSGATLFMTLLAGFKVLLARYSGQDDLLVGIPIAGRTRKETESLIGFFVNTLVMRGDLSGRPGFEELLARVRETALGAYAHQDLPFEKLVEELRPERDRSRSPLFQVMFQLLNTPREGLVRQSPNVSARECRRRGLQLEQVGRGNGTARFELVLTLNETRQGVYGALVYDLDLFEAATISRMLGHFENLLVGIVADPSRAGVGTAAAERGRT